MRELRGLVQEFLAAIRFRKSGGGRPVTTAAIPDHPRAPLSSAAARTSSAAGRAKTIPAKLPLAPDVSLPPWKRDNLLVPGIAPIGEAVCAREFIRQFCDCRNYVLTGEALDKAIPMVL